MYWYNTYIPPFKAHPAQGMRPPDRATPPPIGTPQRQLIRWHATTALLPSSCQATLATICTTADGASPNGPH